MDLQIAALRKVIAEHSPDPGGIAHPTSVILAAIRYQFKVVWAGLEPRWPRRHLIAIEVRLEARVGSSTIHIVAYARTTRADVLRLVADALEEHLVCESHSIAAHTPGMLRA